MEIILLKDIEKLGDKHEIVKVKPGFARNYLIPQKAAIIANARNRAKLDEIKAQEEARENARISDYKEMADKLLGQIVKIGAKAGKSGKIFGSVNALQISNAIKEQFDLDIDRKKIELVEEVKNLGSYNAKLNLHKDIAAQIVFEVVEE